MYHKLGMYAFLKAVLSVISVYIVTELEKKNARTILADQYFFS